MLIWVNTEHRKRYKFLVFIFFSLLLLNFICLVGAIAKTYPSKPIRFVVTSLPGSGQDIIGRLLGRQLTEALGQQVIVDNRPGASGRIAAETVARAAPDGYTLLMMTSQLCTVEAMYKDLNYSLTSDFSPVALLGISTSALVINPLVPANSVKDLIALAKSRPGQLKYGSGGPGSPPHLLAEVFRAMTGTVLLHVPYNASPAALVATVTGEVEMSFQNIPSSLPLIKSGKLKVLGVTSMRRTPMMPDLSPISDIVPGYDFDLFQGLLAPVKTPRAVITKLKLEIDKAMLVPALREQLISSGYENVGSSPDNFSTYMTTYVGKMREAVKLSGSQPASY